MKRAISTLLGASALALSASAALATEYTYGSFLQPTVATVVNGQIPFFERVAKRTNDDVTFNAFWAGAMGGPKELLGAIDDGVLDSGLIVDVYTKKSLPHASALSAAFILADDTLVWGAAVNEFQLLHCPECREDFANNGQIGLAWYATTPYVLQCTSSIRTLADLKGKKVRAVSRLGDLMAHMGAVPVSVTVAEMYEAMQRGQVDCALGSANYLNTYNIKDFVTTIVDVPIGAYVSTLTLSINLDAWEGMSTDSRQVILDEIPQLLADIEWAQFQDDRDAIEAALAKGGELVTPDDAFLASLEEMRADEWEALIAAASSDGVENSDEMIAKFRTVVEKWRGIIGKIGHDDRDAFEAALRDEIFSKLKP